MSRRNVFLASLVCAVVFGSAAFGVSSAEPHLLEAAGTGATPVDPLTPAMEFQREHGIAVVVDGHEFNHRVVASKMLGLVQSRSAGVHTAAPADIEAVLEAEGTELASQAAAMATLNHLLLRDAYASGRAVSVADAEAYEAEARRLGVRPAGRTVSVEAVRMFMTLDKVKAELEATNPADPRHALTTWFAAQLPQHEVVLRGLGSLTAADLPGLLPANI